MIAIDTNIFLYALDRTEPAKQLKAQAFLSGISGDNSARLLWQVIAELLRNLRRWRDRGQITDQEVDVYFASCRSMFPLGFPLRM